LYSQSRILYTICNNPARAFLVITANLFSDQVYEHLLRMICNGELEPGTWLREADLATRLGVSRTPVREALNRLAAGELGELKAHRGLQLRCLTRDDLIHLFQVRIALECMAIKLAVPRFSSADFAQLDALSPTPRQKALHDFKTRCFYFGRELHGFVAKRCGNPILAREITRLHDLTQLAHKSGVDQMERIIQGLREHLRILAALKARDQRESQQALRDHLRALRKYLIHARAGLVISAGKAPMPVEGITQETNAVS
jgi:DNA-binding GntR family transcriptional regulator